MIVDSEMGVETTRSGPNSSRKPLYCPHKAPRATSSPSTQTRGSRRISWSAARRPASINVTSAMTLRSHILHIVIGDRRLRPGRSIGKRPAGQHLGCRFRIDTLQVGGANAALYKCRSQS